MLRRSLASAWKIGGIARASTFQAALLLAFIALLALLVALPFSGAVASPIPQVAPTATPEPQDPGDQAFHSFVLDDASRDALGDALIAAMGQEVKLSNVTATARWSEGTIVVSFPLEGANATMSMPDNLNLSVGDLTVRSQNGVSRGLLRLQPDLWVEGPSRAAVMDGFLNVALLDPILNFRPAPPPAADGSEPTGAEFTVVLQDFPRGLYLFGLYSSRPEALTSRIPTTSLSLYDGRTGVISNPSRDIAFTVHVGMAGGTNEQFGATNVMMTGSREWHDQSVAEGRSVLILKVNEDDTLHSTPARCEPISRFVQCHGTFTGASAGFSLFGLVAISGTGGSPPLLGTPPAGSSAPPISTTPVAGSTAPAGSGVLPDSPPSGSGPTGSSDNPSSPSTTDQGSNVQTQGGGRGLFSGWNWLAMLGVGLAGVLAMRALLGGAVDYMRNREEELP